MESKFVLFLVIFFLPSIIVKAQPQKLCNVQGVLVQRIEPKTSLQANREIKEELGYDPKYFKAMPGIPIEAKRESNGEVAQTKTDEDGNYVFKNLADGVYVISPALPKDYEKAEYYATVAGRDCIESKDIFEIHTTGNLKGRIENLPKVFFQEGAVILFHTDLENTDNRKKNSLYVRSLIGSSNCIVQRDQQKNIIDLDCKELPTGKYFLIVSWFYGSGEFSYPEKKLSRSMKQTEFIEIKKGQTTNISFKIP